MFKFFRKKQAKVFCLGLDGVPYTLLCRLSHLMPNLSKLAKDGTFCSMNSSIPEVSCVAWTSFMTGTDPGNHGIFGFYDLREKSFEMYFPNRANIRAESIWESMEKRGKRIIMVNVPSTYPAPRVNGVLISGFIALDLQKAVYPPKYYPVVKKMGYQIDVDLVKAREDSDFLIKDLFSSLKSRMKTVDFLMKQEEWQLFIAVITGTDRLQHFLWDAIEDTSHVHHQAVMDYYSLVDDYIGRIIDSLHEDVTFLMLSDHGFTGIKTEICLNPWLEQNGFLSFDGEGSYENISSNSRAFAMDPSRIYINTEKRFKNGKVTERNYNNVRDEIAEKLMSIDFEGKKVIKKVIRKEEIYSSSLLSSAPDLLLISEHGYDLKGSIKGNSVFRRSHLCGMHTQDDAFFLIRGEKISHDNLSISDLFSLILGKIDA